MTIRELLVSFGFSFDAAKAKQAEAAIDGVKTKANSMVNAVVGIGAALGVAFGLNEIKDIADEWNLIDARVGLVTKSAQEQKQVLSELYDIANDTRQVYGSTSDLYTKMARSSKDFGATQEELLSVTQTVNQALVVGGASTAEANSTILQLGQALASGRLQGDELRSLGENASLLMEQIAKAYGVTVGALKQMGADGELTSEGVFKAILQSREVIDQQFRKMPLTIGQALTVTSNKFGKFINTVGKETGIFLSIARGIVSTASGVERGVNWVVKALGGWNKMFRIAAILTVAFGAGLAAVKFGAIVAGIRSIGMAINAALMGSSLAAPMFWAVAAAVILLALALEDVYTWIDGGDSLIGDWLGSWEDFRDNAMSYMQPLLTVLALVWSAIVTMAAQVRQFGPALWQAIGAPLNLIWIAVKTLFTVIAAMLYLFFNGVLLPIFGYFWDEFMALTNNGQAIFAVLLAAWNGLVNGILLALKFWTQVFTGDFKGAIDTVIAFFENLLDTALAILSQIGAAIGQYVLSKLGRAGQMLAKFTGIDLSQVVSVQSAGATGRSGGVVNQQVDVNVTVPPGTPADQAAFVEDSAEASYTDTWGRLGKNLEYGPGLE